MKNHAQEVLKKERFQFGSNWREFLQVLNQERIELAEQSLLQMLELENLSNMRFLDIGSGSGLFSLAARRLGAVVHSFDYDPESVACTAELKNRFYSNDSDWIVEQGSVLDQEYLMRFGQYDIVYSWGVLHHTGSMWESVENAASLVLPGGTFFIALYNHQQIMSPIWTRVKKIYNWLPKGLRWMVILPSLLWIWGPRMVFDLFRGKPFYTWRNYASHSVRGMSAWRDLIDWVGGYPFEVAKPDEVLEFFRARGFCLEKLVTCGGKLGCNQFLFKRS
jgi:2-polyprenyl-3-methyl-5-hydroxy-6-metoxy-1,4-benzoquinol methylase